MPLANRGSRDNNQPQSLAIFSKHCNLVKSRRELDSYCLLSMRKGLDTVEMTNLIIAVSLESAIMGLVILN